MLYQEVWIILAVNLILSLTMSTAYPAEDEPPSLPRTEVGILPAVAYDSDLGLALGAVSVIARLSENKQPFDWRVQAVAVATTKIDQKGNVEFPLHNDSVAIDIPAFTRPELRLMSNIAFRKYANAGYYGLGNQRQRSTEADGVSTRFHQYDRIYPGLAFLLRWQLYDRPLDIGKWRVELFGGTELIYNDITVYDGSALQRDLQARQQLDEDGATLRGLLFGTDDHLLWRLSAGLLWDTRDHEFTPTRGTFTELSARFSPGIQESLTHAGFTFSSGWFFALHRDRLVLATRAAGDLLVGTVPFYELTTLGTFDRTDAPGGARSVRGVLRQRYGGKIKLVLNTELRGQAFSFSLFEQQFRLGGVLFADAGRVWTDYSATRLNNRNLDGSLMDFSLGLGGGLRLQWGDTFIIRGDYAYSPTDDTSGFYIDIGQVF